MSSPFAVRRVSDTENRLRLLLCVDALGLVTREQLWPFVAGLELMEYVPMCLFTDELLRDGSLAAGAHAAEGALYVTYQGRSVLRMFGRSMPGSDRERILAAAPGYAASLQEKRLVRAVHELAPGGRFRALCMVLEEELPTLRLRLETGDGALAERAMGLFKARATGLLKYLYGIKPCQATGVVPSSGNNLEEAMAAATAESPVLCAFGKHEHAAAALLAGNGTEYRVALMLPSEAAAKGWAMAVVQDRARVFRRVHGLLTQEREP